MRVTEVPTPQVLVERSRLLRNLQAMQRTASAGGLRLRPHAKTHKSPAIARLQLQEGAVGICAAKIGEAEVFVAEGLDDVRLPYPVHPSNAHRLLPLLDRARVSIIVDHPANADGWSAAMHAANRTLTVLVKVDVGYHRCGVDPRSPAALSLIRRVADAPGLDFGGLLSHAGHAYHATSEDELRETAAHEGALLRELADAARRSGVEVRELSVGATPTARFSAREPGLTELRCGNYAYYDRSQVSLGAAQSGDCALSVMATVVTKPARDRLILDCGSKTLTSDAARGYRPRPGHGDVFRDLEAEAPDEDLVVERLSEEHATVRVLGGSTPLEPGDRVRVVPNHSCVVSNLVDEVLLVDRLEIVETLPVAARGRIQ